MRLRRVALLVVALGVGRVWWSLGRAVIAMVLVAGSYLALGLAFPHGLGLGDPSSWLEWATLTTSVLAGWGLAALVLLVRHGTRPEGGNRPIALGPWLCFGGSTPAEYERGATLAVQCPSIHGRA